jgi:2'-5' RNA ligase
MIQAINLQLKIKPPVLHKKRKPHITLVYPFDIKNQKDLEKHILKSIKNIKPFKITLKKLKKSKKEYYLSLTINQGKPQIMKIYRNLNSGILKNFKNPKIQRYVPHMTLRKFKSKKEIDKAMKDIKSQNLEFSTKINSIQLLTLKKNDSIKSVKSFQLK